MCLKITNWIWKNSTARGNARLVLLVLADLADDEGRAFPGAGHIAKRARCSVRAVWNSVEKLVELGELVIEQMGGPGRSHRYRVVMQEVHDAESALLHSRRSGSEKNDSGMMQKLQPTRQVLPVKTKDKEQPASLSLAASIGNYISATWKKKSGYEPDWDKSDQVVLAGFLDDHLEVSPEKLLNDWDMYLLGDSTFTGEQDFSPRHFLRTLTASCPARPRG